MLFIGIVAGAGFDAPMPNIGFIAVLGIDIVSCGIDAIVFACCQPPMFASWLGGTKFVGPVDW